MSKKTMVLGFLFSEKNTEVALIQKVKPEWQKGFLNGVGGKKEDGESLFAAMCREFEEETGMFVNSWEHCITFECDGGTVFVWKANESLKMVRSIDCYRCENGEIVDVCEVNNLRNNNSDAKLLDNLHWMIPLLLDNLEFPITLKYNSRGGCNQEAEFIEKSDNV